MDEHDEAILEFVEDFRETLDSLEARREEKGIEADGVLFTVPKQRAPTGRRVHFAGRRGPLGEIMNVQENENGGYNVVARFLIDKLRGFFDDLEAEALNDE